MKRLSLMISDEFFNHLKNLAVLQDDDTDYTLEFNQGKLDHIRYDPDYDADLIFADAIFKAAMVFPTSVETVREFIERKDND